MYNRKTISKNATKKIANFINSATKITMSTSSMDIYDCWTRHAAYEISSQDAFDFMSNDYNYRNLRVDAFFFEDGEIESVEISTYADTIELTFEEVEEVEETKEETQEETQEQQLEDVKGVAEAAPAKTKITYAQFKELLDAGWISPLHHTASTEAGDIKIDEVCYKGEWMTVSAFNRICFKTLETLKRLKIEEQDIDVEFRSKQVQGTAAEPVKWTFYLSIINEYLQHDVNRTFGHYSHIKEAA